MDLREMTYRVNDEWSCSFQVTELGRYLYTVRVWVDSFGTWQSDLRRKLEAGQNVTVELKIGSVILRQTATRAEPGDANKLGDWALLREEVVDSSRGAHPQLRALDLALGEELTQVMRRYPDRSSATIYPAELAVVVDRPKAVFSTWYELCIRQAREGKEEYLNSEKYEIKHWDWNAPGNLRPLIERVNRIRRQNPSLQSTRNIELYPINNDSLLCYGKTTEDRSNMTIMAVNLDPHHQQSDWVRLPLDHLEIDPGRPFLAHDLLTDDKYVWQGPMNYIELDPRVMSGHILRVQKRLRQETDFDYFL